MSGANCTLKAEVPARTGPELQTSQLAWYGGRKAQTSTLLYRFLLHLLQSVGLDYIDELEIVTLSWRFARSGLHD